MKKSQTKIYVVIVLGFIAAAIPSLYILNTHLNRDKTNYSISKSETQKAINLINNIPSEDILIGFGGGKGSAYQNHEGKTGSVIWMEAIGVHVIQEPKGYVMRFSTEDHFDTFTLTESLDENQQLLDAFKAMISRAQFTHEGPTWNMIIHDDHTLSQYLQVTPLK